MGHGSFFPKASGIHSEYILCFDVIGLHDFMIIMDSVLSTCGIRCHKDLQSIWHQLDQCRYLLIAVSAQDRSRVAC